MRRAVTRATLFGERRRPCDGAPPAPVENAFGTDGNSELSLGQIACRNLVLEAAKNSSLVVLPGKGDGISEDARGISAGGPGPGAPLYEVAAAVGDVRAGQAGQGLGVPPRRAPHPPKSAQQCAQGPV
jgi:hypothetical protein